MIYQHISTVFIVFMEQKPRSIFSMTSWCYSNIYLVGGLDHFFPYIGNFIIPTNELIFFRGVGIPATSIHTVLNVRPLTLIWMPTFAEKVGRQVIFAKLGQHFIAGLTGVNWG